MEVARAINQRTNCCLWPKQKREIMTEAAILPILTVKSCKAIPKSEKLHRHFESTLKANKKQSKLLIYGSRNI